jgi:hypothetical protein
VNEPFPFGLPGPTQFYLCVYLLTLLIHIVFMNYVLAGSAYLAVGAVLRGRSAESSPIYEVLRDWMPFMLSAAITAGVAPLLFLQVLYEEQFYTANLLLFYRWMAILPALIAAFYLSYLLKAKLVRQWPGAVRILVGCGAFACMAFVGWSWVENHLLSLQPQAVWAEQYESESIIFRSPELVPRLALWFVAAFPTMALVVAWQLWLRGRDADRENIIGTRRASAIALAGIVLSSMMAGVYFSLLAQPAKDAIMGAIGVPYLAMSILGGAIQAVAWVAIYNSRNLSRRWLIFATVGLVVNFIGMAVVNETTRLAAFHTRGELAALYELHAGAFQIAGLPLFVVFFVVNGALIAFCIQLVRRSSTAV